jgi:hypothetical protein
MVLQELVPVCAQLVQALVAKRFLLLPQLVPLALLLLAEQLVPLALLLLAEQLVRMEMKQLAE